MRKIRLRHKTPEVVHSPEEAIVDRDSCSLLHSVASAIFDMPQKFFYGVNWRFLVAEWGDTDRISAPS